MDITLMLLADAANVTSEGKLNLLGVFHTIFASAVPATHPSMYLVMSVKASEAELGRSHTLGITLQDPQSNPLVTLETPFDIPYDEAALPGDGQMVIQIINTVFPQFGTYHFDIAIDGESKRQMPLYVRPVANIEQLSLPM